MLTRYPVLAGLALTAAAMSLTSPRPAGAQEAEPAEPPPAQRFAGVGPTVGPYTGFGLAARLGLPAVAGAQLSAGWVPVLVSLQEFGPGASATPDLRFYSSLQLGGDVWLRITEPKPGTELGAQVGLKHNTVLGLGFSAGGYADLDLSPRMALSISLGLLLFPDGVETLKDHDPDLPSDADFQVPGPELQVGISLALLFYP